MLLKKIKFIGLVLFTMLFFSCDEKQFFSEYKELDGTWKKSDTLRFAFEQKDTLNSEKEVLENIVNYTSRIKFKEERLEELEEINNLYIGDYTIVSPNYSEVSLPGNVMYNVMTPKTVYSYDNKHYFIRGGSLKTHPDGSSQFNEQARVIMSKPFYRGQHYSFGDSFIEEKSRSRQDISREILHRLLLAQHIHKCQTSIRIMADTGEINGISIHFHIKFGPSAQLCTRTNPVGSLSHTQRLHTGINSSCHTGTFILVYFGKRGIGQQRFLGQTRISDLIGYLIVFFTMLFAISEAANRLGLEQVSVLIAMFIQFGASILLGAVILVIGFWLANVVANVVQRGEYNSSRWLANLVRILIMGLVIAMGLKAMGIADSIVNLAFGLTLGSVAVAFALAFGLGGRQPAERLLTDLLDKAENEAKQPNPLDKEITPSHSVPPITPPTPPYSDE